MCVCVKLSILNYGKTSILLALLLRTMHPEAAANAEIYIFIVVLVRGAQPKQQQRQQQQQSVRGDAILLA